MNAKCSGSLAVILAIFVSFLLLASAGEASGQEESCRDCHAGQAEWSLAPDVYRFWNGSQDIQDGGHGDEDVKKIMGGNPPRVWKEVTGG